MSLRWSLAAPGAIGYKHYAPNGAVVLHRNVTRCFAFAGEGFYMKIYWFAFERRRRVMFIVVAACSAMSSIRSGMKRRLVSMPLLRSLD
jgi:hypothetical protein